MFWSAAAFLMLGGFLTLGARSKGMALAGENFESEILLEDASQSDGIAFVNLGAHDDGKHSD